MSKSTGNKANRRTFLGAMGLLGAGAALGPSHPFGWTWRLPKAQAQTRPKLVIVRTIFDLRDVGRSTFSADLAPLSPWQSGMVVVRGLSTTGEGSEYHNGKQKRFGTSCRPQDRNNRTHGGGAFDGKSVDVATGEYLQTTSGCRNPFLVLGAYPYTSLQTTFETMSFLNKNQYAAPQYDLGALQTQINTHGGACGSEVDTIDADRLRRENQVIEAVMSDLSRSRANRAVETQEQVMQLEAQFDALRQQNLDTIDGAPVCTELRASPLAHGYSIPADIRPAWDARVRDMNYTAALALRTNFTNVVTLNYNFSGHYQSGVTGFHGLTHPSAGGGNVRPPNGAEIAHLDRLSQFQVQMVAHLFRELEEMGVLEDSLVVYAPHERAGHNHRDLPVIAYGARRTGMRASGGRAHDVNKDILDHFGVPGAGNFGGERSAGGIIA